MMFDEILAVLRDNGKSGLAYGKTIKLTEQAIDEDPDRAIAYKLLGTLAERFIESTGRLAITTVQTEKAFDEFSGAVDILKEGYATEDPAQILASLNKVAITSRTPLDLSSPLQA